MKKYMIEIKWGVLFAVMNLLWMMLEKSMGLHDEFIEKHATYTNLVAIPAIILYVVALLDKRKNDYNGVMTFKQGFISGLIITLVVTLLSPLTQYITSMYITPEYFNNVINYTVENGMLTKEAAEKQFNLNSYIIQGLLFAPVMGIATSLIVALFTQKKPGK
ncbi:MAG: DUF4199 domain-containing protein [Bacteroidales bacterium]|nr:DUF4199 domain-containing protein [Bacteroidales bacterium]